MNENPDHLENQLCDSYEEQLDKYKVAVNIAEQLPAAFADGTATEESLAQLGRLLQQVAMLDQQISEARQTWNASGRSAGQRLRDLVHATRELLQRLLQRIGQTESAARQARERLNPELRTALRSVRMRDAYIATQRNR